MKSYMESNSFKPCCPEFRSSYCYDHCNWFGVCLDFEDELEVTAREIKEMKKYEPGTLVMLCVGHLKDIPQELKDMDQRIFRIKKSTEVSKTWRYYELYGCVSKAGVPWCIEEDWIHTIKTIKEPGSKPEKRGEK